jgi:hypothetical protein
MFNVLDRSQRQPSKRANKLDVHFMPRQIFQQHFLLCANVFRERQIQEMREESLLRPVHIKPGESEPESEYPFGERAGCLKRSAGSSWLKPRLVTERTHRK